MDVFELVQSIVASKPAKMQALFMQLSDQQQQTAKARHEAAKAHKHGAGHPQQQGHDIQPPCEPAPRQGDQPHLSGCQAPSSLAVPTSALPLVLRHMLPSSTNSTSRATDGAPLCALGAPDMHLVQSVLLLHNGVVSEGQGSLAPTISKASCLSRLESSSGASRRAAALHRCVMSLCCAAIVRCPAT